MLRVKPIYVLIARDVSVDSQDQMLSINKIIEAFNIELDLEKMKQEGVVIGKDIISGPFNYCVVTSWQFEDRLKDGGDFSVEINVIDNKGVNHGGPIQTHSLPKGIDKVNVNFNMQGLPVTGEGKYKLHARIVSDGSVLATGEYDFRMNIIKK